MIHLFRHLALLSFIILLAAACGATSRRHITATMDDVESYINEHPDSALAVLEGVDSAALTTRALRARYSLLHVMALDKCYKDITTRDLLDPAAAWYEYHGTADEKMKTLFYQGRIAQDRKDQNSAAVYFARAEEYASRVKDKHALGLLYLSEASVYNAAYNTDKEIEYREKALCVFKQSHDSVYYPALGSLGFVYHSRKEWQKADSLYRIAIAHSEPYPHALELYLSNYARMKVQQPDKDPEGTIELLNRKRELSNGGLTPQEAGAYAYALALTGDKVTSSKWKTRLESFTGSARYDVLPWLMRMARLEGDSESAFQYLAETRSEEDAVISETLSDSVTQALQDYYENTAQQERERKLRQGLWAMGVVVFFLALTLFLIVRERRIRAELDRLLSIRTSLEQELIEQESRAEAISSDMSVRLEELRSQLQQERLARMRKVGYYGYWMWMEQNRRFSDREVVKRLRKDLRDVCALESDCGKLAERLDQNLDGMYSRLKTDLQLIGRPGEERFLCYWLVDLKPDMIAELMNTTTNNVYVKTHRLEERIRQLNKQEYACLIEE